MQESFATTGDFFTTSGVKKIRPFRMNRRLYSLLNIVFWNIVVLVPGFRYLIGLLVAGDLLNFSIAIGICSACNYLKLYCIIYRIVSKFNIFFSLRYVEVFHWNVANQQRIFIWYWEKETLEFDYFDCTY